jgi:hypothetical protein
MDQLLEWLVSLAEWENFAIYLPGMTNDDVEIIKKDKRGTIDQKRALYSKWLEVCPTASWNDVITALERDRKMALADDVRQKLAELQSPSMRGTSTATVVTKSEAIIDEKTRENIVRMIGDVLRSKYVSLHKAIGNKKTIERIAGELYAKDMITEGEKANPKYDSILGEFKAALSFKKLQDFEVHLQKFIDAVESQGGPAASAARELANEWKTGAAQFNVLLNIN